MTDVKDIEHEYRIWLSTKYRLDKTSARNELEKLNQYQNEFKDDVIATLLILRFKEDILKTLKLEGVEEDNLVGQLEEIEKNKDELTEGLDIVQSKKVIKTLQSDQDWFESQFNALSFQNEQLISLQNMTFSYVISILEMQKKSAVVGAETLKNTEKSLEEISSMSSLFISRFHEVLKQIKLLDDSMRELSDNTKKKFVEMMKTIPEDSMNDILEALKPILEKNQSNEIEKLERLLEAIEGISKDLTHMNSNIINVLALLPDKIIEVVQTHPEIVVNNPISAKIIKENELRGVSHNQEIKLNKEAVKRGMNSFVKRHTDVSSSMTEDDSVVVFKFISQDNSFVANVTLIEAKSRWLPNSMAHIIFNVWAEWNEKNRRRRRSLFSNLCGQTINEPRNWDVI